VEPPLVLEENPENVIEDSVTQRTNVYEIPITPMDENEMIKLKKDVDKTIEDTNNVVVVPEPPVEEDKILEEVKKIISEPSTERAITIGSSEFVTTMQQQQQQTELETATAIISTELPIVITVTAAPHVVVDEVIKTTTLENLDSPTTTTTIAAEAEAFITNNESTNNYDDKLSIVELSTEKAPQVRNENLAGASQLYAHSIVINYDLYQFDVSSHWCAFKEFPVFFIDVTRRCCSFSVS